MRWKLLRRRLSISAPRMIVRSHLPWPLRWAVAALVFGFSAAIALWAFEFGKDIAGLDRGAKDELTRLRNELKQVREDRDRAQAIANTADSLLKAERSAQDRLAEQLRKAEADNLSLKADLGFFERLVPTAGKPDAVAVRGFQAQPDGAGSWRYQLLVMQGPHSAAFNGRYELSVSGMLAGKPWSLPLAGGAKPLQVRSYARVEGRLEMPPQAVVKQLQVSVLDANGTVRATEVLKL